MLWRALAHVENGCYVDVGAQSPVIDSVSLAFYQRGWRGIHVEAVQAYAEELKKARPDEIVIQAAVAASPGKLKFFTFPDTGLSTSEGEVAARHVRSGFRVEETTVKAVTLDEILEHVGNRDVHWLKIDVEGGEQAVLQGWQESPVRPWIVVVESTLPLTQTDVHDTWESLLLEKRYAYAYFDGLNRYYISEAHRELASAFSVAPNLFDDFTLSGTASSPFCHALSQQLRDAESQRDAVLDSVDVLERTVKQRDEQLEQWKARAGELASNVERLQERADSIEPQLELLSERLEATQQLADARQTQIASIEPQLAFLSERLEATQQLADGRQLRIEAIESELTTTKSGLSTAWRLLDEARKKLETAEQRLAAVSERLQVSEWLANDRAAEIVSLRMESSLLNSELQAHKARVEQMLASRSWRVTRPLRVLARLVRNGPDEIIAAIAKRLGAGAARRWLLASLRPIPRLRMRVLQQVALESPHQPEEVPAAPPIPANDLSDRTILALAAMDKARGRSGDEAKKG